MAAAVIRRLLIANRGEIAVRIARACREMGVAPIAVYSDPDERSPHVGAADAAVDIGPAPARDSYLSIEKIIAAARSSGADAIHPGYGFLSENAAFAAACAEAGFVFVGPAAQTIARMGSKIEARALMQGAGVPVIPGEVPHDQTDAGVRDAVLRIGLPALIKASAGGGGKGMRRVDDANALADAIQAARREATGAFGDGTLYVERAIDRPHHVEVQVFGDAAGNVVHLFERECSVQRRHQKVIEESPSPILSAVLRDRITAAAVRAARAVSYVNAGTIEFLVDTAGDAGSTDQAPFYFLEMNTRLQVEHPITEQVVGVDLVQAQIRVASGEALPWRQDDLVQRGHAIEARVYAEDPARDFLPQAGRLLLYREPRLPGVRVDGGACEGSEVTVHYDPLLAKVIATAETRDGSVARLGAALRDFPILGIQTNVGFLLRILDSEVFRSGQVHTRFLDEDGAALAASGVDELPPHVEAAMAAGHTSAHSGSQRQRAADPWDPRGAR